jgi:hypothetical protein
MNNFLPKEQAGLEDCCQRTFSKLPENWTLGKTKKPFNKTKKLSTK